MQRLRQHLGLALLLVLALAACAPKVTPVTQRDGENVLITVTAQEALYSVTLHAFNAVTDDGRCFLLNETDTACEIGDIPAGGVAEVIVAGEPGTVECIAFGFSDPTLAIRSYRPYFCDHSQGGI